MLGMDFRIVVEFIEIMVIFGARGGFCG